MSERDSVVKLPKNPDELLGTDFPMSEDGEMAREAMGAIVRQTLIKKVSKKRAKARRYAEFKYLDVDDNGAEFEETLQIQSITKAERDKIYAEHDAMIIFIQQALGDNADEIMEAYQNPNVFGRVMDWSSARNRIKTRKILYGCLIDWTDDDDNVVWSADPSGPRLEESAIKIVETWDSELIDELVLAIDDLGSKLHAAQQADLQGK